MSEYVRQTTAKAVPWLAALFCVIISASIVVDYWHAEKFANDFGVYWRTANSPVEQAYLWKGRFPFPYAPTMLLWIQPLALVPKWTAYFVFTAVSLAAFILAFRAYASQTAIALALVSPTVIRGVFTGQVSALLSAVIIWAVATERRLFAGIALGLIASAKPQLVLMAPLLFILNRDWKAFMASGATFVAAVLLSLVLFGPERWPEWVASMDHFKTVLTQTNIIKAGVSPATLALRYGGPPLLLMAVGTVIGAATVYLCRNAEPLPKTTALVVGSVLTSPYALAYDLTAIAPFLAIMALRGNLLAPFALAGLYNPLPLVIATWELIRKRALDWATEPVGEVYSIR